MMKPLLGVLVVLGLITGCAETKVAEHRPEGTQKRDRAVGYKIGAPYQIKGKRYYPKEDFNYAEAGIASWYGAYFNGRATANGEIYDMNDLTAAHKTLPMPSVVRVTNLENGRSLKLRVNDRGPFVDGRIIDVSRRASQLLGFHQQGIARVKVEIIADESRVLAGLAPDQVRRTASANVAPKTQSRPVLSAGQTLGHEVGRSAQAVAYRPAESSASTGSRGASLASGGMAPLPVAGRTVGGAREVGSAEPADAKVLYVQTGAYSYVDTAETVRAQLQDVGPVTISPVQRDGRDLFRVRVGPLTSEDEADRLLAAVVRAGFSTSRVVHE